MTPRQVCTSGLYTSATAEEKQHKDGTGHLPHEHAGAPGEGPNRIPQPYIGADHGEKARTDARAHLFREQGVAPVDPLKKSPGPRVEASSFAPTNAGRNIPNALTSAPGGKTTTATDQAEGTDRLDAAGRSRDDAGSVVERIEDRRAVAERGPASADPSGTLPRPGTSVALRGSLGVASEATPDAPASRPGGNGWSIGRAPEPRLVRCRERGDLDPMRDELDRIGAAARRWLDRNRA